MRFLYVYPHPDDESFGPGSAVAKQVRQGHEVHLLTLTRGGATKQRHRFGLSVEQMGAVRVEEMQCVRDTLGLRSMEILDYPDGGLDAINPLVLENEIAQRIASIDPDVVVTYPVHGISVHPDHIVAHAVVKGAFAAASERRRRLAFFILLPIDEPERVPLRSSPPEKAGCAFAVDEQDIETARRALACYATYRETVEAHDPLWRTGSTVYFELWQETHPARLQDLTESLPR